MLRLVPRQPRIGTKSARGKKKGKEKAQPAKRTNTALTAGKQPIAGPSSEKASTIMAVVATPQDNNGKLYL